MVQVLIWNGPSRPPGVQISAAGFSGAVPSVGSLLTVRSGAFNGTIVGQVEVKRIVTQRRAANYELTQGVHPQVGDFLRAGSSWAEVVQVNHGGARRGDIVEVLEDGVHPGRKIVTGDAWNDPCDYSTEFGRALTQAERSAGEWPDFVIIDGPGATRQQMRRQIVQELGIAQDLPSLHKMIYVERTLMPQAAIDALRIDGRVTATWTQFRSVLRLKDGLTLAGIRARLTARDPDALTRLYD